MNKFVQIAVVVIALLLAINLGFLIPTAHVEVISVVLGVVVLIACFYLRGNVWMLIPCSMLLIGTVNILPGSLEIRYYAIPLVCAFLVFRYLIGARDFTFRLTVLDVLVLIQGFALLQAYIRNPVGLGVMGSDLIGGKAYLYYALGFVGFVILGSVKCDLVKFQRVVFMMVLVAVVEAFYCIACGKFAQIGYHFERVYGAGFSMAAYEWAIDLSEQKVHYLKPLANVGMLIMCTQWRPITGLNPFHPIRCLTAMITTVCLLLGGFRSLVIYAGALFIVGTLARRKAGDLLLASGVGVAGLCVLIALGNVVALPYAVQRSISFLPGVEVRGDIADGAQGSIDWRIELWKLGLSSDEYIHNKVLGDGFGMSLVEHQMAMDEKYGLVASTGAENRITYYLAKGSYHGFHVETIRFTGIVGLIMATILLIYLSVFSWKLTRYFYGSEQFNAVLLITVPMMLHWIYYWVVFGTYKTSVGFALIILQAGLVKMLDNIRHQQSLETTANSSEVQPS